MPLRSIISIPASGPGLDDALASQADAVLFTLADDTFPVAELRAAAVAGIARAAETGKASLVTVNHPRTRLTREDIEAVVSPNLAGVLVPHATEPQDVRDLAVLLREFELKRGVEPGDTKVFPVVDTARGLLRSAEIASAAPRVGGVVFHSRNYAHDVGARDEQKGDRLAYARGQVVAVARGLGGLPLIVCDGLEMVYLAQYGFAGAILPDPRMVPSAAAAFTPHDAIRVQAQQALEKFERARIEGLWVARHGGKVVDAAAAKRARSIVS